MVSLKRAITHQDSEMQRPSDWIKVDPAFADLKKSSEFTRFLKAQKKMDHPPVARGRVNRRSGTLRSVASTHKRSATQPGKLTETDMDIPEGVLGGGSTSQRKKLGELLRWFHEFEDLRGRLLKLCAKVEIPPRCTLRSVPLGMY